MLHLYRFLLLLYPSTYRLKFGAEMMDVLSQAQQEFEVLTFRARLEFSLREIAGLLGGAFQQRLNARNVTWSGGFMQSFRFPRLMLVGMVLTLLAVLMAIESARLIASQGASMVPPWGALFFPFVFAMLTVMGVLGLIGYGILVALRRIGYPRVQQDVNRRTS